MKSTSLLIKTSTALPSFRGGFILVILTVASTLLLPNVHAVNPPPDGGYPDSPRQKEKTPFLSLDYRHGWQHSSWFVFAPEHRGPPVSTPGRRGTLLSQHRERKYGRWRCRAFLNTTGEANTAVGVDALLNNSIGEANTATGDSALL